MVRHIVFWTLKDEAEGAGKEANAAKVKELLEGLRGQIPGMLKIEVGRDFSASPVSADIMLPAPTWIGTRLSYFATPKSAGRGKLPS